MKKFNILVLGVIAALIMGILLGILVFNPGLIPGGKRLHDRAMLKWYELSGNQLGGFEYVIECDQSILMAKRESLKLLEQERDKMMREISRAADCLANSEKELGSLSANLGRGAEKISFRDQEISRYQAQMEAQGLVGVCEQLRETLASRSSANETLEANLLELNRLLVDFEKSIELRRVKLQLVRFNGKTDRIRSDLSVETNGADKVRAQLDHLANVDLAKEQMSKDKSVQAILQSGQDAAKQYQQEHGLPDTAKAAALASQQNLDLALKGKAAAEAKCQQLADSLAKLETEKKAMETQAAAMQKSLAESQDELKRASSEFSAKLVDASVYAKNKADEQAKESDDKAKKLQAENAAFKEKYAALVKEFDDAKDKLAASAAVRQEAPAQTENDDASPTSGVGKFGHLAQNSTIPIKIDNVNVWILDQNLIQVARSRMNRRCAFWPSSNTDREWLKSIARNNQNVDEFLGKVLVVHLIDPDDETKNTPLRQITEDFIDQIKTGRDALNHPLLKKFGDLLVGYRLNRQPVSTRVETIKFYFLDRYWQHSERRH